MDRLMYCALAGFTLLAAPNAAQARKSTFNQLLKSGKSVECTFATSQDQGKQEGTFYISGKNMRGDFTITPAGSPATIAHTLQTGDWVYMWGGPGGGERGTKFKVSEAQRTKTSRAQQGLDLNQEVDVDCRAWSPVSGKFTPPADIAFQDITSNLQGKTQAGTNPPMEGSACSACDQAPLQSQGQCRQALGCK